MEYKEFIEEVMEKIKNYLPDKYQDRTVFLESKYQNGIKREGIVISKPGELCPILYLERFYEDYVNGFADKETIYKSIAKEYQEAELFAKEIPIPDSNRLEDYLEQSFFKAMNYEKNKSWLQGEPYILLHDIALVPYIDITDDAKMRITSSYLSQTNIKKEELLKYVLENNARVLKPQFKSMQEILNELSDQKYEEEESPSMYVLTGKEKKCGASLIADAKLMQRIREQIGEDYYVLPSSIHETLILPQSKAPDPTELKEMVMAVNRSEVEPEDFLSDNVYKYKASRKAIELAVPDKSRERRR